MTVIHWDYVRLWDWRSKISWQQEVSEILQAQQVGLPKVVRIESASDEVWYFDLNIRQR